MPRKLSELAELMGDPIGQINEILVGTNLFRKAELEQPVEPSPEYADAFSLLEPWGEYVTVDGADVLMVRVHRAADLIADNYERRVL